MIRFQSAKLSLLVLALTLGAGCEYYGQVPQVISPAEGSMGSGGSASTEKAGVADTAADINDILDEEIVPTDPAANSPSTSPAPVADASLILQWGTAARLDVNSDTKAKQPEVSASANGDVVATWKHGMEMTIGVKKRTAAGVWEKAQEINSAKDPLKIQDFIFPQLTIDDQGVMTAVWATIPLDDTAHSLEAFQWAPNLMLPAPPAMWTPTSPTHYAQVYGEADVPVLSHDTKGNVILAYEAPVEKESGIAVQRLSAGQWSERKFLTPSDGESYLRPRMTVDSMNRLTVAYIRDTGRTSDAEIQVRRFLPGPSGDWSDGQWEPEMVVAKHAMQAFDVRVAADAAGLVMVTWIQYTDSNKDFVTDFRDRTSPLASVYDPQTRTWSLPMNLEADDVNYVYEQRLVSLGQDRFLACWLVNTAPGVTDQVRCNRFTDGVWQKEISAESFAGNASALEMSADGKGHALLVWSQQTNGAGRIAANLCDASVGCAAVGAKILDESLAGEAVKPSVALTTSGHAVVVWEQKEAGQSFIGFVEGR